MMWFFLTLAMFTLTLAIHCALARTGSSLSLVFRFLCVGVPLGLIHVVVSLAMFGANDDAIAAILVYGAMCEVYIFLFTLTANGVSISLMDRIADGATKIDVLDSEYSEMSMVARRVHQLEASGFLTERGGRLQLSAKAWRLVRAFVWLRSFFGHAEASITPATTAEKSEDSDVVA